MSPSVYCKLVGPINIPFFKGINKRRKTDKGRKKIINSKQLTKTTTTIVASTYFTLVSVGFSLESCHNVCLIVYYVYATFDALWVLSQPCPTLWSTPPSVSCCVVFCGEYILISTCDNTYAHLKVYIHKCGCLYSLVVNELCLFTLA